MHTSCLNLSEALSGYSAIAHTPGCTRFARLAWGYIESVPLRGTEGRPTTVYPRLHSLRSFSLGLLKVYLSEALREGRLPYTPRLHSLRSFSLGLLKVYLSEALSMFSCLFGIAAEPHPYIGGHVACYIGGHVACRIAVMSRVALWSCRVLDWRSWVVHHLIICLFF